MTLEEFEFFEEIFAFIEYLESIENCNREHERVSD